MKKIIKNIYHIILYYFDENEQIILDQYKTGVTNKFSIKGLKDNDKKYVIIFALLCNIEFIVCDSGKFIDVYKYLKKINLCEKAIGYLNVDIGMEIKNKINIVERINVGIINIK